MNLSKKFVNFGSIVSDATERVIPLWVTWICVWPIFTFLGCVKPEKLSYMGNGEFEYLGDSSERELGRAEALACALPIIFGIYMLGRASDIAQPELAVLVLVLATLYSFASLQAINHVEIEKIGNSNE